MECKLYLENSKLVLEVKDAGRITTYRGYSMTHLTDIIKELFN